MAIDTIDSAWREDNTLGDAGSGKYKPLKAPMRRVLKRMESSAASGTISKATRAQLFAITPLTEDYGGIVYADPVVAYNGIYVRDAAAWTRVRGLPDGTAVAENIGGTENAITCDVAAGVDPSNVQLLIIPAPPGTNSSAAVTIAISGGAPVEIESASGGSLAIGAIVGGVGTALFRVGSEWRQLISSAAAPGFDHQGS